MEDVIAELSKTDTPMLKSGLSKAETGQRTLTVGEAVNLSRILGVDIAMMTSGPVHGELTGVST